MRWPAEQACYGRVSNCYPMEVPMDLEKLKRVENLAPGDAVKAWGDDLEVLSARPQTDGTVEVVYDGVVVEYGAGTVIETA